METSYHFIFLYTRILRTFADLAYFVKSYMRYIATKDKELIMETPDGIKSPYNL